MSRPQMSQFNLELLVISLSQVSLNWFLVITSNRILLELPSRPTPAQLRKLVGVANYQFGKNVGSVVFGRAIQIVCSDRTGRIRHIYREGKLIATLRPRDGYLALTTAGASMIVSKMKQPPSIVRVENDVSEYIKVGGDVFAKHVVVADENLSPADEVIVTDNRGFLLGVGRAVLSGREMERFKRGVAVKVRRGVDEANYG